ncbi:unnamed protein product [Blepharisma stoltei]|uniref:glycine--tRNA ligase n=1 Tax=Blepharisma stoltei TaxID=1481888 RepID=A0AAU9J529_9CILI|nr:unnamed protein product [Blepharisma stoltei]
MLIRKAMQKFPSFCGLYKMNSQEELKEGELESFLSAHRPAIDDLLRRRFFYRPSFEIYGGISGLFDYGPPGCALKREVEDLWRQHFILEEDMLELAGTNLTPEVVLEASGHVAKFTDFMVKDEEDDRCWRADKLLVESMKEIINNKDTTEEVKEECRKIKSLADTYKEEQLHEIFTRFGIKCPGSGRPLSYPKPFNLMFGTMIGPSGRQKGFLRPETAQGIFVNFKNLYDYNRNKLPFAVAQIGLGFRNEISPRDGLLRVREFTMAEIEYFVNPSNKDHHKFQNVAAMVIPLFGQEQQELQTPPIYITLEEAVTRKIINNQTLAYFMARTYLFLRACGIKAEGIRFRQHMKDEMAHYSSDCWDAEILLSIGWVEVVGHADRSCYDLTKHAEKSKKNLLAAETYPQPRIVDFIDMKPNKGVMGAAFKAKNQLILAKFQELSELEKASIKHAIEEHGEYELTIGEESFKLTRDMIKPEVTQKSVSQETFYPSVIEPSFGIGRIIYSILEHAFRERTNVKEARSYLYIPPVIAPVKCCVLPLSKNPDFDQFVDQLKETIKRKSLSCEVDDSSTTIGKKYARCDEIGIPFAVTVDFQTVSDHTVTLRETLSMTQVRIPLENVGKVIQKLVFSQMTWENVQCTYPAFATEGSTN